jgi:hypothetical protein
VVGAFCRRSKISRVTLLLIPAYFPVPTIQVCNLCPEAICRRQRCPPVDQMRLYTLVAGRRPFAYLATNKKKDASIGADVP